MKKPLLTYLATMFVAISNAQNISISSIEQGKSIESKSNYSTVATQYISNLKTIKILPTLLDADTIVFNPLSAKYIRIMINSAYDNSECGVDEIEIFPPKSQRHFHFGGG